MRKFLPHILIIIFCLAAFFANAQFAHAAVNLFDVLDGAKKTVAILAGYAVYMLFYLPAAGILWLAGQIFNFSLTLSLNSGTLGKDIVTIGWGISRDVANLFFIFILLYISIATILRLSGYGAKELLTRLVMVALLVNFSLVFSQAVIDMSNILALEFYNSIKVGPSNTFSIAGAQESPQDLSAVFMSGFSPQKLFASKDFEQTLQDSGDIEVVINVIIKFILAAIITIMAAFILLAAAGLFIIRTVILWLLMILAPIAFISMILPATRSTASRWWSTLFKQSFFAPAFLFFYYLVAQMINHNFFTKINSVTATPPATGLAATLQGSLAIFMQFSVLGILLIACLVVAQEMGAHGASAAMAWGAKGYKMAVGYVGQTAARHTIAPLAQKAAASPAMQNIAASFPRTGGWALRALQKGAKAGGAEELAAKRAATGRTLAPQGRAEYLANADKRTQAEMMKGMSEREIVEMEEANPAQKATIQGLTKNMPVEKREKIDTIRKERESAAKLKNNLAAAEANPSDIINAGALMAQMTTPQLNKIMDEGGAKLTTVANALKLLGADFKDATQNLAKMNPDLAASITTNPRMRNTLGRMAAPPPATPPPATPPTPPTPATPPPPPTPPTTSPTLPTPPTP